MAALRPTDDVVAPAPRELRDVFIFTGGPLQASRSARVALRATSESPGARAVRAQYGTVSWRWPRATQQDGRPCPGRAGAGLSDCRRQVGARTLTARIDVPAPRRRTATMWLSSRRTHTSAASSKHPSNITLILIY